MATKVISKISLDVADGSNLYKTIRAKQGDTASRAIRATITADGEPLTIANTSSVYINFMRYDGSAKSFRGEVESSGTLFFDIPLWALELPYTVLCDVSIVESDNSKLTTHSFYLRVDEAAVTNSEDSV